MRTRRCSSRTARSSSRPARWPCAGRVKICCLHPKCGKPTSESDVHPIEVPPRKGRRVGRPPSGYPRSVSETYRDVHGRFTMRTARILVAFALCAASFQASAMPNFTRREGFDCSTCHVNIPRLNRFGYEFRNAGFRIPSIIGDTKQKSQPDFGTEQMHFNLRAGVFHPWEGYGASDRPLSIARPTFQRNAARGLFYTPWGFDQAGVEGGFTFEGFNVAATLFNGLTVHDDGSADDPYHA